MSGTQAPPASKARFSLHSERLGPLPLVNHFLQRIGLEQLLDQHVPTRDRRSAVAHAQALGVLLRSIIVEREPIYRQQETAVSFAPSSLGSQPLRWGTLAMIASAARWIGCLTPIAPRCSPKWCSRWGRTSPCASPSCTTTRPRCASAGSTAAPADTRSGAEAHRRSPTATPRTTVPI